MYGLLGSEFSLSFLSWSILQGNIQKEEKRMESNIQGEGEGFSEVFWMMAVFEKPTFK